MPSPYLKLGRRESKRKHYEKKGLLETGGERTVV